MSVGEFVCLVASAIIAMLFLYRWYHRIFMQWPARRGMGVKVTLGVLPPLCSLATYIVLVNLASFDVVDDGFWLFFYVLFGLAWLAAGLWLLFFLCDISWTDDALNANNPAAAILVAAVGGALTAIFVGANVGDGPGWWCVLFAGALGLVVWFALAWLALRLLGAGECITSGRDLPGAVRVSGYLLAISVVLARACSGDWHSFELTLIEFLDFWPVLPVTLLALGGELALRKRRSIVLAALLAALLLTAAIVCIILLPSIRDTAYYQRLWERSLWM